MSNLNINAALPIIALNQQLKDSLLSQIPKLQDKKILVVGDVGLDEYVMGQVRRISPEAPVPVLDVEQEDMRLGLAANVAQNIRSLGGSPVLVSVVGNDTGGAMLSDLFRKAGVSTEWLVIDKVRPTTRKVRVMAKHHHLVRFDYELRRYLSAETEAAVIQKIQSVMAQVDAVIIEDYAKGVISDSLLSAVVAAAKKHNKRVLVDPHKLNRGEFYKGIDLLKPNYDEAVALAGLNEDDLQGNSERVNVVAQTLLKKTGAKELVITRGKDGMVICSGDKLVQVPTYARQVFDVTGAGDTVIAALALGLSAGLPLTEACMLANFAAGVVVGQVGCVPCTVPDLQDYIRSTQ